MSEWRCRNRVRGNREHFTPITTARRKKQLVRLMKGVQRAPDTSCCKHRCMSHANDERSRAFSRPASRISSRLLGNSDGTRVSSRSMVAHPASHARPRQRTLAHETGDVGTFRALIHHVNNFFGFWLAEASRTLDSDRNRANRGKVIRGCAPARRLLSVVEGSPATTFSRTRAQLRHDAAPF